MNSPSLDKVEGAFLAAVAEREAGRPVDVTQICGGNEALAEEVRSLLRHLDAAGPESDAAPSSAAETLRLGVFLNPTELHARRARGRTHEAVEPSGAGEWGASTLGQRVGEFTLVGQLGAGGMGIVFVAAQDHPARTVALKLVRRAVATPTMVRRFEREAQLLGRLNHPGIAQVYAAGVTEIAPGADGTTVRAPFIAMELVEGPTILAYVRLHRARAGHALALRLVAQVCDAIEHAHLRGVIHRDLKPANVLIATDGRGGPQVKVLDFGVARQSDDDTRVGGARVGPGAGADREPESLPTTQLTLHGHLIGTLAYMSPEQVGSSGAADARCDVYALGAILHQLLSDSLPIDVTDCTIVEAARRIAEHEPPRLGTIDRALRGDVETIVAKALEKDPARRYQSPGELARDVRHYLAGEPIEARRESLIYVLRKRASRYRALSAAAVFTLACAVVFSLYARDQHARQVRAAQLATEAHNEAEAARRRADATAARLTDELGASLVAEGRLLGSSGDLAGAERLLWDAMFARPDAHVARWALWELYCNSGCAATLAAHAGECRAVVAAPDGKHFATCGDDALVRLWSLPGGEMVGEHDTGCPVVRSIAYAPDGREIAAAGEGGAVLIDALSGGRRALMTDEGADAWGVDVSADGSLVAVAGGDGTVRVYDRATARELLAMPPADVEGSGSTRAARCIAFDSSGDRVAAGYDGGTIMVWSLSRDGGRVRATPGPAVEGHHGAVVAFVRFHPDGELLASGGTDRNLKLWRVADGALVASTPTNNGTARAAAFSADGRFLAVPGFWRTRFFDARSAGPLPQPRGMKSLGDGGAFGACFTPDGRYLITAQSGGSVRVWDLMVDPSVALVSTPSPVRDLAALRVGDECVLATAQADGTVLLRAAAVGRELQLPWRDVMRCNAGEQLRCVALAPDASRVIVGRADGHVLTLDGRDGRVVQDLDAHRGAVGVVRLTPDGRRLVSTGADGYVRVWRRRADDRGWDAAGGAAAAEGDVVAAALSPDGTVLVTGSAPASLRLWSVGDGGVRLLHEVATEWAPWRAAFSADGARLAVGTWDREIQLWNTRAIMSSATHAPAAPPVRHELDLVAHTEFVAGQAFDDAGRLLASVSSDGTMRVWDLREIPADGSAPREASSPAPVLDNRRCLATLDAHAGDAWCVSFLPAAPASGAGAAGDVDQSVVAVGYADGTVRLWNLHHFHDAIVRHAHYQRGLRGLPVRPASPATAATTTRSAS